MGGWHCVLCKREKLIMTRDKKGYSKIIDPNPQEPNGVIKFCSDTSAIFSCCESPECHEKLYDYIYQMCIDVDTKVFEIDYNDKKYKFPIDKRILKSLPGKLAEIKKEKDRHEKEKQEKEKERENN